VKSNNLSGFKHLTKTKRHIKLKLTTGRRNIFAAYRRSDGTFKMITRSKTVDKAA
jgi:hypothetical protein